MLKPGCGLQRPVTLASSGFSPDIHPFTRIRVFPGGEVLCSTQPEAGASHSGRRVRYITCCLKVIVFYSPRLHKHLKLEVKKKKKRYCLAIEVLRAGDKRDGKRKKIRRISHHFHPLLASSIVTILYHFDSPEPAMAPKPPETPRKPIHTLTDIHSFCFRNTCILVVVSPIFYVITCPQS